MAQNEQNHEGGYILLARKIRDNSVYSNSIALHIWIECLLRASYRTREFFAKRELVKLEEGEFLMGYREFSKIIGCSASTIKYWFDVLISERFIERETNTKGTRIKVLKWKEYQAPERFVVNGANTKRTPSVPNKKVNEVSNESKIPPSFADVKSLFNEKGFSTEAERFFNFYESKGWMVGKNKMCKWRAAVGNWLSDKKPAARKLKPGEIRLT